MDDFQLDDSGLSDLTGFDDPVPGQPASAVTAPVTPTNSAQHARQRATSEMISTGYRLRQFLKKGGAEFLFLLLFWLLYTALLRGGTFSGKTAATGSGGAAIPELLYRLLKNSPALLSVIPELLFSLLTVSAVFFTSRKLGTPETGIAAAATLILFPLFARHVGTATSAAFAFTGFSLLFQLKAGEKNNTQNSLLSGFLWMTGLCCLPTLLPVSLAFAAGGCITLKSGKNLPFFIAGAAAAFIITELLLQSILGHPVLHGMKTALRFAGIQGTAPGTLFPGLFTAPALAPFSLLALFALGYTARAGSGSFPTAPAIIFLGAYLLLDLIPVRTAPLKTLAGDGTLLALPLSLICGIFIGSLLDKKSLRWLIATCITLAAAALLAAG